MEARALRPKQRLFVKEYLVDKNATRAAIAAGYSPKTARSIGAENLTKPDILEEIEKGLIVQESAAEKQAEEVSALKKLSVESFRRTLNFTLMATVSEIENVAQSPNLPALEVAVARSLLKAIRKGDFTTIQKMVEGLVGEIPDPPKDVSRLGWRIDEIDYVQFREVIHQVNAELESEC